MDLSNTVTEAHLMHHHHRHLTSLSSGEADTMWLMFGAVLVFFMQTGFAMLEVGSVHSKNTRNILLKNVLDASIGAILWWLLGFGFAQGGNVSPSSGDGFIGTEMFALKFTDFQGDGDGYLYAAWLFQWAFAATTATIVSGAVAERVTFTAYCCYSFFLVGFIYPVVVCWGWNTQGWLSAWREEDLFAGCGAVDFAGSCVVHMTGGIAALVGASVIGPRSGFPDNLKTPGYGPAFQTLGVLILWFGWYGFNGVSTLYIVGFGQVAAKTMVTTTISAGTGAITCLIVGALLEGKNAKGSFTIRLENANNGVLAGLVGITAGCSTCEPVGAFFIGMTSAPVYLLSSMMLKKFGIDDVVEAAPVHGFCGMWGTLMAGCFATKKNYEAAYYADRAEDCAGIFYGGDGSTLASNIVLIIMNIIWTGTLSFVIFFSLNFFGLLRIDHQTEEDGMDFSEHGAPAFSDGPKEGAELVPTKDATDPTSAETGV